MRLWNGHPGAYNGIWRRGVRTFPAEPRRAADCRQRPLRPRFRQQLTRSVRCLRQRRNKPPYPSADTLFLTRSIGVSDSHGMDIVFTQHARSRMADPHRGIVTEEEVRSVLATPTVRYVGIDGKQNVLGEVNGKRVRICFVEDEDRLLVITVINRGTGL
jgi:hypothetical protein